MQIQTMQTKVCQHKWPDFQRDPSNLFYIRKLVKKSSRADDVMTPKKQEIIWIQTFLWTDVQVEWKQ